MPGPRDPNGKLRVHARECLMDITRAQQPIGALDAINLIQKRFPVLTFAEIQQDMIDLVLAHKLGMDTRNRLVLPK